MLNKKILITGAAGFVGSQFVNKLIMSGFPLENLKLVDNLEYGHLHNLNEGLQKFLTVCDVLDMADDFVPDLIFHFAGISSLPECESNPTKAYKYNVVSTARILDLAKNYGSNVVFASTSAIYEKDKRDQYTEDLKVSPRLIYPQTKLAAEQLCLTYIDNYDLKVLICRISNVFGAHQDFTRANPPFTSYLVKQLLRNKQIIIYNDDPGTLRDYIYIDDLMLLLTLAVQKELVGIYNITSSKCYSTVDIIQALEKTLNEKIKYIKGESFKFWENYPKLFGGKKPLKDAAIKEEIFKKCHCSNYKIMNALGLTHDFISIEKGLLKIIEFQKNFI